jgi:trans-2,3-dihydro-3-hydroxyanthranilate isomerase
MSTGSAAPIILEYSIADVFTDTALAGNPVAVVIDSIGLPTERMQAIAREFNLSETTFVQRRPAAVEQTDGIRVRIFTTQEELPFAGHPTLGTASVLKMNAPETANGDTITLALNVGPISVRFEDRAGDSTALFGEMTQRDPEFGAELDPAAVAQLIGLDVADLDRNLSPQVVSTGNVFAIVPLRSSEPLARINVKQHESTDWLRARGARWFFVLGPTGEETPAFRARMQFNGGEDPATGSAAGCAISYLVARGAVRSGEQILLRQGVEISRSSDLFLSAKMSSGKVSDVRVAGSTVLVAKGQLFLP